VIFYHAFEYIKEFFLLYFRGYTIVKREDLKPQPANQEEPLLKEDKPIK